MKFPTFKTLIFLGGFTPLWATIVCGPENDPFGKPDLKPYAQLAQQSIAAKSADYLKGNEENNFTNLVQFAVDVVKYQSQQVGESLNCQSRKESSSEGMVAPWVAYSSFSTAHWAVRNFISGLKPSADWSVYDDIQYRLRSMSLSEWQALVGSSGEDPLLADYLVMLNRRNKEPFSFSYNPDWSTKSILVERTSIPTTQNAGNLYYRSCLDEASIQLTWLETRRGGLSYKGVMILTDQFSNADLSGTFMLLVHPPKSSLEAWMQACKQLYWQAANSPSADVVGMKIAKIALFYNAWVDVAPLEEGSAIVGRWLRDSLCRMHGIAPPEDITLNLGHQAALSAFGFQQSINHYGKWTNFSPDKLMLKMASKIDVPYFTAQNPDVPVTIAYNYLMGTGWRENKGPRPDMDVKDIRDIYCRVLGPVANLTDFNPLLYWEQMELAGMNPVKNRGMLKPVAPLDNPEHYLAIVALFRNEARFLKEWIEYYLMMGVGHLYLYNHLSEDGYEEVLRPYIEAGQVTLTTLTFNPKNQQEWYALQCSVYSEMAQRLKGKVRWMLPIDTDEFLEPKGFDNLVDAFHQYDDVACVSIGWQLFGTGGVQELQPGELMVERMTKTTLNPKEDGRVKSIVDPRSVDCIICPHFPFMQPGHIQMDEKKQPFGGQCLSTPTHDSLRLIHYWARDEKFLYEVKLGRPHIQEGVSETNMKNSDVSSATEFHLKQNVLTSAAEDRSMADRFGARLRARMFPTS